MPSARQLLAPLLVLAAIACGGGASYQVQGTSNAPGADAEVIVTPLDGRNFRVDIHADHLPPPGRMAAGATVYVVWVEPTRERPVRLGSLPLEGSRSASMYGTTVEATFEVLVTAETRVDVASPSEHIVLRQRADLGG
ncbi:MAG: hypothetical protein ACFCGT_00100 [Sandaracinaceae bacterium]